MSRANTFGTNGQAAPGRSTTCRPIAVSAEDECEFLLAMESYKQQSGRNFPTWSEILEVLRSLGYAKRIWRPVEHWTSVASGPIGNDGEAPLAGWFSRVETLAIR